MITVLVSLIFIGGYYFVYFKAQSMITDLLTNLVVYGDKIKGSAYLLFREFKHFTSSPGYMLYISIFIAVNVVAGLTLYIWLKTRGCERFAEL